MLNFIRNNAYYLLALTLFIFECFKINQGIWIGDFWEHSAVVNELIKNPFSPSNPILNSAQSHAFINPYSLLVALIASLLEFTSIKTLSYFAFINLAFLLSSLYYLMSKLFKNNTQSIAALAFLLVLFFYGKNLLLWSGFYHFYTLHFVLPFPSTFSLCISLVVMALLIEKPNNFWNRIICSILSGLVVICHPTTALFLFTGCIAISYVYNKYSIFKCVKNAGIIIVSALFISSIWPYFNFLDLLASDNQLFHEASKKLYYHVFQRFWPVILALVGLLFVKRTNALWTIALSMLGLYILFKYGYNSGKYGFSRVIANISILANIALGAMAITWIYSSKKQHKVLLVILLGLFVYSIHLNKATFFKTIDFSEQPNTHYYTQFSFLNEKVNPYDVILSDKESNWIIPSYKGKVIASKHPLYWINDQEQRRKDVRIFFENSTSIAERNIILNHYKPNYILINSEQVDVNKSFYTWLEPLTTQVYAKHNIRLLKVN